MSAITLDTNPAQYFQMIDNKGVGVAVYKKSMWNKICRCFLPETYSLSIPNARNITILCDKQDLNDFLMRNLSLKAVDVSVYDAMEVYEMVKDVERVAEVRASAATQTLAPQGTPSQESLEQEAQKVRLTSTDLISTKLQDLQSNGVAGEIYKKIDTSTDREDAQKAARILLAKLARTDTPYGDKVYRKNTSVLKESADFHLKGKENGEELRGLLNRLIEIGAPIRTNGRE